MPSVFSNEIAGTFTPGPAAPVLLKVVGAGQTAKVSVQLPTLAEDGNPLTSLTSVNVFYKTSSMVGSTPAAEVAAGTPYVSLPVTPAQAGQTVEVDIPGLTYGTEYFFDADCDG
jgi:hypothetical protein